MSKENNNILLVAGSGRNVGKTTFACKIIQNVKNQKPVAVKITSHFHSKNPEVVEIEKGENWVLFEETNQTTQKDSSLFLQNGAVKSYLIQAVDNGLVGAFLTLEKLLSDENPVIIESASLIKHIKPGMFVVVLPDGECQKKEIEAVLNQADLIVISDGKKFFPSTDRIKFDSYWKLK